MSALCMRAVCSHLAQVVALELGVPASKAKAPFAVVTFNQGKPVQLVSNRCFDPVGCTERTAQHLGCAALKGDEADVTIRAQNALALLTLRGLAHTQERAAAQSPAENYKFVTCCKHIFDAASAAARLPGRGEKPKPWNHRSITVDANTGRVLEVSWNTLLRLDPRACAFDGARGLGCQAAALAQGEHAKLIEWLLPQAPIPDWRPAVTVPEDFHAL